MTAVAASLTPGTKSVPSGGDKGGPHIRGEGFVGVVAVDDAVGRSSHSRGGGGSVYWMRPGEKASNCKGSYLQKYLDGRFIASYPLTSSWDPGQDVQV